MGSKKKKINYLFLRKIANAIVHEILENALSGDVVADKYRKELTTSFEIAKRYREKINPINRSLPDRDLEHIKVKIVNRVRVELNIRISKGYKNIDLFLVDELV